MSIPNLDNVDGAGSATSSGGAGSYITDIRTISEATQTSLNKIKQGNIDFSKSGLSGVLDNDIVVYGLIALGALFILKKV